MTLHLFGQAKHGQTGREALYPGAVVLRGFAVPEATAIFAALHGITTQAPFRHMLTPGGLHMSVAMTNCGAYGWWWSGGPARLRYHGVMPLKEGHHHLMGGHRINLTFRKAA